jgi:hypothetical protein
MAGLLLPAAALLLVAAAPAGAQCAAGEGAAGKTPASQDSSLRAGSSRQSGETQPAEAAEPLLMAHLRATHGTLSSAPLSRAAQEYTLEQRLQAELASLTWWTPEKAAADRGSASTSLLQYSQPESGSSDSRLTAAAQPATGAWKPYEGSSLTLPGTPIPYIWTGGQGAQIFRLTW